MKTPADWLRDDDPLTHDPGLSEAEVAAMRRRVVTEAIDQPARRLLWREAVAIAAALAMVVTIGVTARRRAALPLEPAGGSGNASSQPGERRQLQFATPGGTRIIWTFDADFSVKGTNP